jgi:hypothetical protein
MFNTPNRPQAWGTNMKWIWNPCMSIITWGSQYDEWRYEKSMNQKACELLYPSMTNTQCCWFYQMFWEWYNPKTNKFKYSLNSKHVWYNMTVEEIGRGFTISDL